jgi:hypothetical protein
MKYHLPAQLLLVFPAIVFSTSEIYPSQPYQFQGITLNNLTKQPVENVHLYVVSGEEETLSGKDGVFKLTTWQQLPVTVMIEHSRYKTTRVLLKEYNPKTTILLDPK